MKSSDFPQLDAMREGIEYSFEISCRKFKVKVRPLTNVEIIQATSAAADALEKLPDNQRNQVTASLLNAMHMLEKASAPDVGEPGTMNLMLLQFMSPDEVNTLWKQYVAVTERVNPSFENLNLEEVSRLVDDLKKSSNPELLLTDFSISNLSAVCLHLLRADPA